jgi:hypothetical protein
MNQTQQSNGTSKPKWKEKKRKTQKKDTFSQETLSPKWIAKGQQSVVIEDEIEIRKIKSNPPPKRPRVRN